MKPEQNRLRSEKINRPRSKYRRKRRARMVRRLIPALLCLVMVGFGGYKLAAYLLRLHSAAQVNSQLEQIYSEALEESVESDVVLQPAGEAVLESSGYQYVGSQVLSECQVLQNINPDLVGWLSVPGELDLPVVYRDNTYYLDHDFYGRENDSGTVFLDADHPFEEDSQYLFLHGHNVWDGSMFGVLTHYRNTDYIKAHPYLYFTTLYRRETYEIFGVLRVTTEDMYGLLRLGTPTFENGAEFNSFIDSLRKHAIRFTNEEISPDDAIMALSTCWEDDRIVVLFRRVDR